MKNSECGRKDSNRIFVYDLIRFIAIIAVVMIHCAAPFVIKFLPSDVEFTAGNFFDSISRVGVPFFVMLSGIFMLDENKYFDYKKLAYKVIKLVVLLFVWSAFYAILYHPNHFAYYLFYGNYHLWYLYMIIGLYLITPVLKLFVKIENKKLIFYFLILALIFQFCPPLIDFCCHRTNYVSKFFYMFKLNITGGFVAYYITGWLIKNSKTFIDKYQKIIYGFGALAIIIIFTCTEIYTTKKVSASNIFYANICLPVFIYSTSLFVFITHITVNAEHIIPYKIKNFITNISKLSFGIYLVHACILELTRHTVLKNILSITMSNSNSVLYILLSHFITFFLTYIIVYIVSKIKYVNQLIKI